jgi:hypothetical protein
VKSRDGDVVGEHLADRTTLCTVARVLWPSAQSHRHIQCLNTMPWERVHLTACRQLHHRVRPHPSSHYSCLHPTPIVRIVELYQSAKSGVIIGKSCAKSHTATIRRCIEIKFSQETDSSNPEHQNGLLFRSSPHGHLAR